MEVIIENLPLYWEGLLRTLFLSVVSGIIALIVGTLLAAARVSPLQHSADSAPCMWKSSGTPR